MNARILSHTLLPFAALTFCSAMAFAQQPPTPPTPATPETTPAPPAPIERQGLPSTARGPRPARPSMQQRGPVGPMSPVGPMGFRMHEHGIQTGPMGFGMERKWWQDQGLVQRLNLTPDQIKRMDSVFEQSKLQLIDLRANVQKQEVLLEPLLSANPVDMPKAKSQIEKVARARADLEVASAGMLLGIRGVLTPDQWTKLNERHERHDFHGLSGAPGNRQDYRTGPPALPPGQ